MQWKPAATVVRVKMKEKWKISRSKPKNIFLHQADAGEVWRNNGGFGSKRVEKQEGSSIPV